MQYKDRLSQREALHEVNVESTYLRLHPAAVGTQTPSHPAQVKPGVEIALQFPHEESLPLYHSCHLIAKSIRLMRIEVVSPFEVCIEGLKVVLALGVTEAVAEDEMDENDVCLSPDPVDGSALVLRLAGSQIFSGSVSDYFFGGGVCFCLGIAVGVGVGPGMIASLVVIALGVEPKVPYPPAKLFILLLEMLPLFDVTQVRVQLVTAAPDNQIHKVCSYQDSNHSLSADAFIEKQNNTSSDASQQQNSREHGLAVHRGLLRLEPVQFLCKLGIWVKPGIINKGRFHMFWRKMLILGYISVSLGQIVWEG